MKTEAINGHFFNKVIQNLNKKANSKRNNQINHYNIKNNNHKLRLLIDEKKKKFASPFHCQYHKDQLFDRNLFYTINQNNEEISKKKKTIFQNFIFSK